ncbi:MAG: LysM peptidoglycan-binding domain-containing protein [Lachnospiraceae bacterium]|nr:LysM peptidoglycan-binding domain-containing protein [Lachnospiraceae bacterium]
MSCIWHNLREIRRKAEAAEGTYTVGKGDYLKKIAKKVYGDENLWKVIYDANSNVVKSNYIIYKGQVLIIPEISNNSAPPPTPTPEQTKPTPAPTQQDEFVLDYDQIAS